MALLGLDRLVKKDLFTAELWNTLIDVLEAKFSSGITESDLAWPLLVQGDIDFQQTYGIVGLRTFWNVVNAEEYASLDAAVSAVEALGGGAVFIPPYTSSSGPIIASNVSIDASNVTIFGAGPKSVIKITAASTGPLITTATSGISNVTLMNLTLDGTGGGAGCVAVQARRVTRLRMINVDMTAFTGDFIVLTNGGVAGQSCVDAYLQNIHCSGGSDSHLFADDVSGLIINGFISKTATGDVISMVPASSSHLIQDVVIANARIHSGGAKGIRIVGSGAAGIDAHSRIQIANCQAISMTGLPFELGNTAALLKDVRVSNCFAPASTTDGLRIATTRGVVSGCHFPAATADGIDATNSGDLYITGNACQDAGAFGINADTTTDCTIDGNNVRDAVTKGINKASATGLRCGANEGDHGTAPGMLFSDTADYSLAAGATGDIGFSYTLPANSVHVGSVIRVTANIGVTHDGANNTALELRIGGTAISATSAYTANSDSVVRWDMYVTALSGANNLQHHILELVAAATDRVEVGASQDTIDFTTDLAFTFQVTANGGTTDPTIRNIQIELLGSR